MLQNVIITAQVSSLGLRKDITPDVVMGCQVTIADTQFYVREELQLFEYSSKLNYGQFHALTFLKF